MQCGAMYGRYLHRVAIDGPYADRGILMGFQIATVHLAFDVRASGVRAYVFSQQRHQDCLHVCSV